METVSFTCMSDGTTEEYAFLEELEQQYAAKLPDRIMAAMENLESSLSGYRVSRLEHSLQSATRAHRDDRSTDYVVAALIHDIGDELAPYSHSELAASILRPFVQDQLYWIIKTHGVFQMYYYGEQMGLDRHARDRFKDHPYFDDAVAFCELYDQNCFDPSYESLPLSFFEPMVREVFSREPLFGEIATS
ncbi:HD domain-containing protein [Granulosicoccus sp.]|nr:HD domain-containing protein [Granulosicoccus sp.]MDB4224753.1 HD domain-containing protein [Granulosicoccus sp.]